MASSDGQMLQGRIALVTGAARGIGRAIAETLARHGADVAVADVRAAAEKTAATVRESGRNSVAAVFDISDPEEVTNAVARLADELGAIDILVNNAGIVDNIAPVARMEPDAWSREVSVNLGGPFNLIQAVIGPMVTKSWGRIVNVSSVAARGGLHNQAGYAASKAGLLGLTYTVALEHARHGITCNTILPGMIATGNVLGMPSEIQDRACAMTPAGRFGTVDEVAELVAFLASEPAGFINGAEIDIDGGLRLNTMALGSRKESRRTQGG